MRCHRTWPGLERLPVLCYAMKYPCNNKLCYVRAHVRHLKVIQMNPTDSNYHLSLFFTQEFQVDINSITFYDII